MNHLHNQVSCADMQFLFLSSKLNLIHDKLYPKLIFWILSHTYKVIHMPQWTKRHRINLSNWVLFFWFGVGGGGY